MNGLTRTRLPNSRMHAASTMRSRYPKSGLTLRQPKERALIHTVPTLLSPLMLNVTCITSTGTHSFFLRQISVVGSLLAGYWGSLLWENLLAGYWGRLSWENLLASYWESLSWENSLAGYWGSLLWENLLAGYKILIPQGRISNLHPFHFCVVFILMFLLL